MAIIASDVEQLMLTRQHIVIHIRRIIRLSFNYIVGWNISIVSSSVVFFDILRRSGIGASVLNYLRTLHHHQQISPTESGPRLV